MIRRTPKEAPDPIDIHVGARVRMRRVGLRLSQAHLGDVIGVTFQQVQKYESGANRIGASNLFKIAGTLEVEVGYFFDGLDAYVATAARASGLADQPQAPFGDRDPMASRDAIELVHNFFRIRDEQVRRKVFQFIKSLADSVGLS